MDTPDQGWTILRVDPLSGEMLDEEERAYRERIRLEATQGTIGVDALYFSAKRAIHQPLVNEEGQLDNDAWLLERANRVTLRVPMPDGGDSAVLEEAAITIARAAIDDFAAEVMLHLFAIANDPPNWRRPEFTVSLSDLLDRLSFKRDARGVHYSDSRRRLSTTLLALHFTHVGVQRKALRHGGQTTGFIAPLLSAVGYATRENVDHLSPREVFEAGLPETVAVSINPLWYQGLRRRDGSAGTNYALIARPAPRVGRPRGNTRSSVTDHIRDYVLRYRSVGEDTEVALVRQALLDIASIKDRKASQATRTLTRALDTLCEEEVLLGYLPKPLPLEPTALITLTWKGN